jgi:hypothetical protein
MTPEHLVIAAPLDGALHPAADMPTFGSSAGADHDRMARG